MNGFDWITSESAKDFMESVERDLASGVQLVTVINRLRKIISPEHAQLVVSQVQLRKRAAAKFSNANEMLFTDKGLQQSTSESIATYKANKFSNAEKIADLCCGIGGDLMSLSKVAPTIGVDLDSDSVICARENCKTKQVDFEFSCSEIESIELAETTWIHIDPDRRSEGVRTTKADYLKPGLDVISNLIAKHKNVAVKVAPATELPVEWAEQCQREWIGDRRETKQQMWWFGELAETIGTRAATRVTRRPGARDSSSKDSAAIHLIDVESFSVPADNRSVLVGPKFAKEIERFVFDLHSTLYAAKLHDLFASQHNLKRLASQASYFTSNTTPSSDLLACFEVVDVCDPELRKINSVLEANGIGEFEIKRRGGDEDLQKKLESSRATRSKTPGGSSGVVLLGKLGTKPIAILAKRQ